jgi:uncharacterized phage protein (TIGR02218 family)
VSQQTNLKVSSAYINWLLATNRAIMGHLYQFTAAALVPGLVGSFWVRLNNELWNNNPLANPATNVGGYVFGTITDSVLPLIGQGTGFGASVANKLTANFGASSFGFPLPTNFTAAGAGLTWNPSDTHGDANFTDDNLSFFVNAEALGACRATGALPTTGVYYEGTFPTEIPQDFIFGVMSASGNLNFNFGGPAIPGAVGLHDSGVITVDTTNYGAVLTPAAPGDTIGIAIAYGTAPPNVGAMDFFTDMDQDVVWGGHTWKSNSLRFEGLQRKVGVGLNVDEQTLKIWAAPTDTIFGGEFLPNVEQGVLDGAVIVRYRIIWALSTGNVAVDMQAAPIAVFPMFTGYTANVVKGGQSHVELKVRSALARLNTNMPRNYYQPGCLWTLFDQGCTLLKGAYAVTGTVGAGPSLTTIPVTGGIAVPTGADGIANYGQGRLQFTSGVNDGLQVLIDNNDASNLYLAYVLNDLPAEGDQITYFPGCSKAFNTCKLKFNNQANFRGFDKVPPIMLSM